MKVDQPNTPISDQITDEWNRLYAAQQPPDPRAARSISPLRHQVTDHPGSIQIRGAIADNDARTIAHIHEPDQRLQAVIDHYEWLLEERDHRIAEQTAAGATNENLKTRLRNIFHRLTGRLSR